MLNRYTEIRCKCPVDAPRVGTQPSPPGQVLLGCATAVLLHAAFACAGLHAYNLDINSITVDGIEARYELRPYVEENLPQNVLEGKPAVAAMPCMPQHMHMAGMAPPLQ